MITRQDVWRCFRLASLWAVLALASAVTFVATGWADGPTYQPRSRIGTPEPAAATTLNWTGLYFSGGVGPGLAHTGVDVIDAELGSVANINGISADGLVGDIRVGLDYQIANSPFLIGVFAGYNFGELEFSANAGGRTLTATLQPEYYAGLRLGLILAQKSLVYVGAAYQPAEGSLGGVGSGSQTDETIIYMVGLEHALTPNLKLGAEYNYGEYSFTATSNGTTFDIDPEVHTFKARLSLSLNFFN